MNSTILDEIVANKRAELKERKRIKSYEDLLQAAKPAAGTFLPALTGDGVKVIAEVKPKSPSSGTLDSQRDPLVIARTYSRFAAAISVLTDHRYFGGSMELLEQVSEAVSTPTLCKDFIVDPYQIVEARVAGAEAVLLIAKILPTGALAALQESARRYGMAAVVEVQNEEELTQALSICPSVILINNRNLSTFEIDLQTTVRIAPQIPRDIAIIAASGIQSGQDVQHLLPHTNTFLIGSSLMRAANIEAKLSAFINAEEGATTCVNP